VETSTFARKISAFLMSVPTACASIPFSSSLRILALTAGWLIFRRFEISACESCGFSESMFSIFLSVVSISSGMFSSTLFGWYCVYWCVLYKCVLNIRCFCFFSYNL